MKVRGLRAACVVAILVWAVPARAAKTNVAVFNFQMRSETPKWVWAEKGFADQITTDFTRSRKLSVLARDEMQVLANKLRWVPEMATDSAAAEQIRKALKIDFLVSGFYTIAGDDIEVVAQVVNVESRKEAARKTLKGKTDKILELQKQVSAELLGWFSGVPAEKILPHLPVWTRSIEATRGLYEGMHLYDQGRYEEAWLKFRQAMREDPSYLEARYWVGRMYYFMDRYEHARRAFERFVYLAPQHPRIGDAIKEYLHTWEKAGAEPQTLLRLYEDFIGRYPEVMVYNEMDLPYPVSNRVWLRTRCGQVLAWLGRHGEAVDSASSAMAEIYGDPPAYRWTGWAYLIGIRNALLHNQLTGKVRVPEGLMNHFTRRDVPVHLRFRAGSNEAVCRFRHSIGPNRVTRPGGVTSYTMAFLNGIIVAPDDHVFRKLVIHPIVDGEAGILESWLAMYAANDVKRSKAKSPADARREGFTFEEIPATGILLTHLMINPHAGSGTGRQIEVHGIRAVAEMEKLTRHGAVDVNCTNGDAVVCRVDDRPGRTGPGVIGLLRPGEHELTVTDLPGRSTVTAKVKVTVEAGKLTPVNVTLPWKPDGPWQGWTGGASIGQPRGSFSPSLQPTADAPALLLEKDAIRVVWSHMGDLWSAISKDGKTFTEPAKLAMPISSGWIEADPKCLRDESGRYVLAFRSDRESQHRHRPYVCWSRDFGHWSRPVMVADRTVNRFDLIQDLAGRFIWADSVENKVTLLSSTDAYHWTTLAEVPTDGFGVALCLLQRDEGRYEMFVADGTFSTPESL